MKKVDRIFIACHRRDLRLTRICVASIRRWYPTLPVYLLKDEHNGPFSTAELERRWNVLVWPLAERAFGWGFVKLEPLFMEERARFLVLDSDIALVGPVLEALEGDDSDFVVNWEQQPASEIPRLYFDPAVMKERDPRFPGVSFTFNSGQFVGTGGILTRADFNDLVHWSAPRRVVHRDAFNASDQGVLNYVLLRKVSEGLLHVGRIPFMKWGDVELASLRVPTDGDSSQPYVVHWAGMKKPLLRQMLRADILSHFERAYYERIPLGPFRRPVRATKDYLEWIGDKFSYRWHRWATAHGRAMNRTGVYPGA